MATILIKLVLLIQIATEVELALVITNHIEKCRLSRCVTCPIMPSQASMGSIIKHSKYLNTKCIIIWRRFPHYYVMLLCNNIILTPFVRRK